MKKLIFLLLLQSPFLFAVFCLLTAQVSFSQDCNTQAVNKSSPLVRGQDNYFDFVSYTNKPAKWNVTKMKSKLDITESWIKNKLAGFTGAKLHYSNTYWLDFVVSESPAVNRNYGDIFHAATGIKGYYEGKMRFFAYYCYEGSNIIHTEGESGSNVHVIFNNVFATGLTRDAGVYSINGKLAFRIIQKKRGEGRIDF